MPDFVGGFPGTSRSMSTIAAGQVVGLTRRTALEFSFFVSMPTMMVATVFTLFKAVHPSKDFNRPGLFAKNDVAPRLDRAADRICRFILRRLGVVAWFMNWVRRRGFTPFAIYRIIVGVAVLLWAKHNMM